MPVSQLLSEGKSEEKMNKEQDTAGSSVPRRFWLVVTLVAIFALVLWLANFIIPTVILDLKAGEAGGYGSMFGVTGALFSGFATAGVIVAILLQRQDLKLQKDELEKQRKVLEIQSDQLEGQKIQMERQAFENNFFELLRLRSRKLEEFRASTIDPGINGIHAFSMISRNLQNYMSPEGTHYEEEMTSAERYATYKFAYELCNSIHPYYENLEAILRFLDVYCPIEKDVYLDILRSELSIPEKKVIFYHCQSVYASPYLAHLYLEFELYVGLNEGGLYDDEHRSLLTALKKNQNSRFA